MPTEAVDTGLSDQELFDEANADEASADEAVVGATEAEPEQVEGQPRDEHGRFAGKADEPETPVIDPAKAETVDDNAPQVPSWRVREINEEKRAAIAERDAIRAERDEFKRLVEEARRRPMETPKEPVKVEKPDPLLDPDGYEKHITSVIEERLLNNHRESSLAQAHRTYKTEFDEAYAAAQQAMARGDRVITMKMQTSRDPGETLIEWHREQKVRAEVGTDPNAFFEKRFEAYLADPANQAKVLERIRGGTQPQPGATRQAAPVNLPPSLTRATNASTVTSADDDDISNDGLWRHANG